MKLAGRRKQRGTRDETERLMRAAFEKIKAEDKPTGPSAFAKAFGITRTYLYTFPELAAEVAAYGRLTQPDKSRRGAGVTPTDAKRRQLDARVRREHTKWSKEVPQLQRRIQEAEEAISNRDTMLKNLNNRVNTVERAYEFLLMLAVEAGVNPMEVEKLQARVIDAQLKGAQSAQ
jgi:hypothetical protein